MSDYDNDLDMLFDTETVAAANDVWQGKVGPVLNASSVRAGALRGFVPDLARKVLNEPLWLSRVNGIWEDYQTVYGMSRSNGLESLPFGFQQTLRREEVNGGERLNLNIAHAAGRGWTDWDIDLDLLVLEAEGQPFQEYSKPLVNARGRETLTTSHQDGSDDEPWEWQFHVDHLTILARRYGLMRNRIVVQVLSETTTRTYRLTLHWANGTSVHLDPVQTGYDTKPARIDNIAAVGDQFPVRVSIELW